MYDGAVKIDTSLDMKGLDEAMRKFRQSIEEGGKAAQKQFGKLDDSVDKTVRNAEDLKPAFKVDDESQIQMIRTLDNVNAKIEVQQRQLGNLQREYAKVATRQGENSDAALRLQKQIINTEGSVESLIAKSDKLASTISEGSDKSANDISFTGDLLSQVFSAAGIHAAESLNNIIAAFGEMKEASASTSSAASKSLDGVGIAGAAIGAAVAGGIAVAISALADMQEKAAELNNEIEFSTARITVALGLTDGEAKNAEKSITSIYRKGLVSDREDAEAALTAVMRLMGAQGKEAEDLTNKIIGIQAAFGEDFTRTARTAATLMQTFGIDGKAALDIITAGLQTSANKNGDLIDVLNEYAPAFERVGFTGEEMLSKIVSATDSGAYSADKAADAFKEFYNKAASDSGDFKKALEALGLNGESSMRRLTSGGQTAREEFERVTKKLAAVSDESKQARIASELFGSQWEDVGTRAVLALSDVNGKIIETEGAAETSYQRLEKNGDTAAKKFERTWGESLTKAGEWISSNLTGPLGIILNLIGEIKTGFSGSGTGFVSSWVNLLNGKTWAKVQGYATGTASATPGLRWVGENGPELVAFKGGEYVHTAAQSMAIATNQMAQSAVGPPVIVNQYFNQRVDDLDTFVAIRDRVVHEQQYTRQGYVGR